GAALPADDRESAGRAEGGFQRPPWHRIVHRDDRCYTEFGGSVGQQSARVWHRGGRRCEYLACRVTSAAVCGTRRYFGGDDGWRNEYSGSLPNVVFNSLYYWQSSYM